MVLDAPLVFDTLCLLIYANSPDTRTVVDSVVELYDTYAIEGKIINDEATKLYIDMIKEIISDNLDVHNKADMASLFTRYEQVEISKNNPALLARVKEIVDCEETVSPGRISSLKSRVRKRLAVIRGIKNLKTLFSASNRVLNSEDANKQDAIFVDLLRNARELVAVFEGYHSEDSKSIAHIDMTCIESVAKGLEAFKAKRADRGYRLGIQKIGNCFGPAGGPIPGESIAFAALSYHYKSGMMMDFARWLATYNHPKHASDKPAAIVFNSLENEIHENMMLWFNTAYFNAFRKSPEGLSDEEIVTAIVQLYKKNGFTLLVFRDDPVGFGWSQWKARHDELQRRYKLIASFTDYLGLMEVGEGDNRAKLLQQLFCNIKNYGARIDMQTYTGLQLDTEAARLAKSGRNNIVKQFGHVHLADCRAIKNELDVLFFLHIEENHLGMCYLTGWLDKHKYARMPDDNGRYFAIPFSEYGLLDDIYGEDSSVPDIYNINSHSTNTNNGLF